MRNSSPSYKILPTEFWLNDVLIWPLTARALIALGCRRVDGGMSAQQWGRYSPGVDYRKTCEDMQATK